MGYVEKKALMEVLASEGVFTDIELSFINDTLTKSELNEDTILKLIDINEFEKKGILTRFYTVCEKHCFFPFWIDNVKKGLDRVEGV